jgi:hypothetical protein
LVILPLDQCFTAAWQIDYAAVNRSAAVRNMTISPGHVPNLLNVCHSVILVI